MVQLSFSPASVGWLGNDGIKYTQSIFTAKKPSVNSENFEDPV